MTIATTLHSLPPELLEAIFFHLDHQSLGRVETVCNKFHQQTTHTWAALIKKDFPHPNLDITLSSKENYKNNFLSKKSLKRVNVPTEMNNLFQKEHRDLEGFRPQPDHLMTCTKVCIIFGITLMVSTALSAAGMAMYFATEP